MLVSLMNLQKLRQISYRNESNDHVMEITLPPNDPLNRVEFTRPLGWQRRPYQITAQARHAIRGYSSTSRVFVAYTTNLDIDGLDGVDRAAFYYGFSEAFLPRLKETLVEHGFHSGYLPYLPTFNFNDQRVKFNVSYIAPQGFINQITHACYTDGRSMRRAVEFQTELNKT